MGVVDAFLFCFALNCAAMTLYRKSFYRNDLEMTEVSNLELEIGSCCIACTNIIKNNSNVTCRMRYTKFNNDWTLPSRHLLSETMLPARPGVSGLSTYGIW